MNVTFNTSIFGFGKPQGTGEGPISPSTYKYLAAKQKTILTKRDGMYYEFSCPEFVSGKGNFVTARNDTGDREPISIGIFSGDANKPPKNILLFSNVESGSDVTVILNRTLSVYDVTESGVLYEEGQTIRNALSESDRIWMFDFSQADNHSNWVLKPAESGRFEIVPDTGCLEDVIDED